MYYPQLREKIEENAVYLAIYCWNWLWPLPLVGCIDSERKMQKLTVTDFSSRKIWGITQSWSFWYLICCQLYKSKWKDILTTLVQGLPLIQEILQILKTVIWYQLRLASVMVTSPLAQSRLSPEADWNPEFLGTAYTLCHLCYSPLMHIT